MGNIFAALQGCKGETASSAFLGFIFENEPALRADIGRWLLPRGRDVEWQRAEIETEKPVGEGASAGRADLWITMPRTIVCVENKHWAPFGDDQPRKYQEELRKCETKDGVSGHMVVVVPSARKADAEKHCASHGDVTVVTWEGFLDTVEPLATAVSDQGRKSLLSEFRGWMRSEEQLGSMDAFRDSADDLRRWDEDDRSERHLKSVNKLWRFFPNGNNHPDSSKWYVGYRFGQEGAGTRSWYGFVRERGDDGRHQASLYILATHPLSFDGAISKCDNFKRSGEFLQIREGEGVYCWRIAFERLGADRDLWRRALEPLHGEASDGSSVGGV